MQPHHDLHLVMQRSMFDPRNSFSIGSFGAIAEFHRDDAETVVIEDADRLTIATDRGGMRVDMGRHPVTPVAYETLSARPGNWQIGVVLCLPDAVARSHGRTVVTEIGPDRAALRPKDRSDVLFDLGLDLPNVDFCVRTADPTLLSLFRRNAGLPLLDPDNPLMDEIVKASPHRIALSAVGRVEVYQAIGRTKTPDGPHTHLLPKLLKDRRTHSANIPVPVGHLPCVSLYPAHPMKHADGRSKPFDRADSDAFASLLDRWGPEAFVREKKRATTAIGTRTDPAHYDVPRTRMARTALRIAVRQQRAIDPSDSLIAQWSEHFDRACARC